MILDAVVESLIELGFARTTTLEVQRRANVSRGALLHHFPSKAELLVAAVRHLAELRGREIHDMAAGLPRGGARIGKVIDILWESFSGPLLHISLELGTAARTDAELRDVLVEVERELHDRILAQSRRLFGDEVASKPGFASAFDLTLHFMIGAAMTSILHGEAAPIPALLSQWKSCFRSLLDGSPARKRLPRRDEPSATSKETDE